MPNFKVLGTVKSLPPVNICGPLSFLHRPPSPCSMAIILTKFRLTSSLIMDIAAWKGAIPTEKTLLEPWVRKVAEMVGLETAFPCVPNPAHFNPAYLKTNVCRIFFCNLKELETDLYNSGHTVSQKSQQFEVHA